MNNLPDNVIQQVYDHKHNLEFVNAMDQLLQESTNVYFSFSFKQCRIMCYVQTNKILIIKC